MSSNGRSLSQRASVGDRALLATLIAVWAVAWPVMKLGVAALSPLWFGCLRYMIGATLFFVVLAIRRRIIIPGRRAWRLIVISGALQMAGYSALTGLALALLPPGRASVLAYSTPLWVVPLGAWRLKEIPSKKEILGVVMGLAGVALIASPSFRAGRTDHLPAYIMLVGAAVLWAVSIVYVRGHEFAATPVELAPWQMLVAFSILLPITIFAEGPIPNIVLSAVLSLAYVAPVATAFGYWAMVESGRHFRANTISIALLATPMGGISISALLLGEVIDASLIGGAVLIGSGIVLAVGSEWVGRHHDAGLIEDVPAADVSATSMTAR